MPDGALRDKLGATVYDSLTGLSDGSLTAAQREVLETFAKHRDAFNSYNPEDAASYKMARVALGELYGSGENPSRLNEVRWLLQAGVIDSQLSEKMADVRNRMVFETCEALAKRLGEVHRMDFSPAKNLLNDIDHTFKSPELLKEAGIDGPKLVEMFNEVYIEKFGVNAEHMDVVSHPSEAAFPDWRSHADVHDFVATLRQGSSLLAGNSEAYFLEGAFRMQVERRSYQSDLELYSIFSANPNAPEDDVARVAVTKGKIRDIKYKLVLPPEMRRSYAWGSSVGNWHFYRKHAVEEPGAAARYAAKYGLRSFAEGPGWLVVYDRRTSPEVAPADYEKMVDMGSRLELVDRVYDQYYKNSGLSKKDVRWTIEKAHAIRKMGDGYNREAAFSSEAAELMPNGDLPDDNDSRTKLIDEIDRRFQANMSRLMVENMKVSLPGRLADWLDPNVTPYQLGYTLRDIKNKTEEVKAAVATRRKQLRSAALLEVMHGLRILDAEQRSQVIEAAIVDLKKKNAGKAYQFERSLRAIAKIASQRAKPRLLQTDSEAGRAAKRTLVGEEEGNRLKVRTDDQLEAARQHHAQVEAELKETFNELVESGRAELVPAVNEVTEDTSGQPGTVAKAMSGLQRYAISQWDDRLASLNESIENKGRFMADPDYRVQAVNQVRKQMLEGFGYEFRKDWRAMEGIDLARDTDGFRGRGMVRGAMNWNNADSLLNIVKVYRETNGNAEKVREQILMEAATRLPMVGEGLQLKAILEGEAHPGMLGVMAAGFFFPAVGQITMAYSIGSNVYFIFMDVKLDRECQFHLQGVVPFADGSSTPGDGYGDEGMKGLLDPVYHAMMKHREELKQLKQRRPYLTIEIDNLLEKVYTPDFEGARRYVYAYFNPGIEEKFEQDLNRWPKEKWDIFKLSSNYAKIRINDEEQQYNPDNQPPMLRALFGRFAMQYLTGKGEFADLPGHKEAHAFDFYNKKYFVDPNKDMDRYKIVHGELTSMLVDAYQDELIRREKGDPAKAASFDYKWAKQTGILQSVFIDGAEGKKLTAYEAEYQNVESVPNIPSFLDMVAPNGTPKEKREKFFNHFDKYLNERLEMRHMTHNDAPKDDWTKIKLGSRYADLRPVAGEDAAVSHPLLLAFFNRQVFLYNNDLEEQVKAGKLKKEQTIHAGQGELMTTMVDPPLVSDGVQKRMVQQLIQDYKAGLIRDKNHAQNQIDRELLEMAMHNAMIIGYMDSAVFGTPHPRNLDNEMNDLVDSRIAPVAQLLAMHSGDPLVDDEQIQKSLAPLLNIQSDAEIKIEGNIPSDFKPGDQVFLSCSVAATPDFVRPFNVQWAISSNGERTDPAARKLDENSNLHVASVAVSGKDNKVQAGEYLVTAYVTDAMGRQVGAADKLFKLSGDGKDDQPRTAGTRVRWLMFVSKEPEKKGTGFMRSGGVREGKWFDETSEVANFTSGAKPHVWADWPEAPENAYYAFVGKLTGGVPATDEEMLIIFRGMGNMFEVRRVKDGQAIFPISGFSAREHVGEYKVSGKLLAYDRNVKPTTRNKDWLKAEPLASKDINVAFKFHGPEPVVTKSYISQSSSHQISGSIGFDKIQRGRRVAKVEVGGKTHYTMIDRGVGFRINAAHSLPNSASVTFENFGEMVTVQVTFEEVRPAKSLREPREDQIKRYLERLAKDREKEGAYRLYDMSRTYGGLASCFGSSTSISYPDRWLPYYQQMMELEEQMVSELANPNWDGYKSISSFRDFNHNGEYLRRADDSKKPEIARACQNRRREYMVSMYANGVSSAAACGMVDEAVVLAEKAAVHAKAFEHEKDYVVAGVLNRMASIYRTISGAEFETTGNLSSAKGYWNISQKWAAQATAAEGREFRPSDFNKKIDPPFKGSDPADSKSSKSKYESFFR